MVKKSNEEVTKTGYKNCKQDCSKNKNGKTFCNPITGRCMDPNGIAAKKFFKEHPELKPGADFDEKKIKDCLRSIIEKSTDEELKGLGIKKVKRLCEEQLK